MRFNRQVAAAIFLICFFAFSGSQLAIAQKKAAKKSVTAAAKYGSEETDRQIAIAFAPVFYQSLGSQPRFDYITKFDFDGDWRGDNNWANSANPKFPLRAFIYYSVAETETHYFIAYAVFHPRDYKGGDRQGEFLSEAIQMGVGALGKYDPTGRASEATLAHENDMEGALVVAQKNGNSLSDAKVQFVETLAHNRFLKYTPESMKMPGFGLINMVDQHCELYIEPRGHGIRSNLDDKKQNSEKRQLLIYGYSGIADDPAEKAKSGKMNYDLLPIYSTLWAKAQTAAANQTYAATSDYATLFKSIKAIQSKSKNQNVKGKIGLAFKGNTGGKNMARPPWGWFDSSERDRPLGEWFFDPAQTVKRHYNLDDSFSLKYLHSPVIGIPRGK